jgi:putative flippase GtrA
VADSTRTFRRWPGGTFLPYLAASAVALAVDTALLFALARSAVLRYAAAAAVAYLVGGLVHYLISRRIVFGPGWLHARPVPEFIAFMASAAVGMAVTSGIVYLASERGDLSLAVAKATAVVVSLVVTYSLRRFVVFGSMPPPE